MKKIAFIMPGLLPMPPIYGGAVETLVNSLLNSKKVNEKYKIDIYSCKCKELKEKKDGNIQYFYINEQGIFNKIEKIVRYIINKCQNNYIGNLFISKVKKKYLKKMREYDYVIIENKPEYGLILKKHIRGKMILHAHNDCLNIDTKNARKIENVYDEIFALSKYVCHRIKEIPGINKEKVNLLYNGVNIEKFKLDFDLKKERKKWKIKDDDFVFLYTGRLVKEKGILELIKAFNELKNSKCKLLIAGSIGYGKTTSNKFTRNLKKLSENNSNIIFTGFIEYKKIPKLYCISDFGIIPSIWEEPFALTVIEHLASGHPVIITNSGAMPELINENCAIVTEKNKNVEGNLKNALNLAINRKFDNKECIKQAKKFDEYRYIDRFLFLMEERKSEI